jgi:large subunit ribosomal protein L13
MKAQKSFYPKAADLSADWYIIDATDQILGRVASKIARIVRGKDKPTYTPSADTGDFVIVINADKIRVTGNKVQDKKYYRHTGYPGGIKERTLGELMDHKPTEALRLAVRGMLPKHSLGKTLNKKVKIYAGSEHPHTAQQPKEIKTV